MTQQPYSRDLDPDEPRLSEGRGLVWVAAALAVLLIGGTAASALVLGQSDNIANRWIAAHHAVVAAAP
jgi:hypothetical protein